jgi:hypothetical protein
MTQFRLIDLFWVTGLAACVAATIGTQQPEIAFVGTACVLFFVWNRTVILRFWTIAMIGIGTALLVYGAYDRGSVMRLRGDELAAWGAAMVVAGVLGFLLFGVFRPPSPPQSAS